MCACVRACVRACCVCVSLWLTSSRAQLAGTHRFGLPLALLDRLFHTSPARLARIQTRLLGPMERISLDPHHLDRHIGPRTLFVGLIRLAVLLYFLPHLERTPAKGGAALARVYSISRNRRNTTEEGSGGGGGVVALLQGIIDGAMAHAALPLDNPRGKEEQGAVKEALENCSAVAKHLAPPGLCRRLQVTGRVKISMERRENVY